MTRGLDTQWRECRCWPSTGRWRTSATRYSTSFAGWRPAYSSVPTSWPGRWSSLIRFLIRWGNPSDHRLNMEVDLQSLFGFHATWCAQLYSLAETRQLPPPPHLDSYYEGAIGQQRYTTFLCNPLLLMLLRLLYSLPLLASLLLLWHESPNQVFFIPIKF